MKVVRYQLPEIMQALSALQMYAIEKENSETMSSAKILQSTPDETFRRDFFLPSVDTAFKSLGDRFSRLKGVYDLYDFLFSKDNMKQMINNEKLHEQCNKLEQTLHGT